MCGIAGIVGTRATTEQIERMAVTQRHRGPDHTGYFLKPGIALTHQRLSIVDLDTRSNQPMSKDGLTLIFNGEVYNFREIRSQLELSVTFKTQSDTEVILEAWRKWGPACLDRLRGMYAFAIYDSESEQTYIARDPFGIKPLFYYPITTGGLAFASELKTLESVFRHQFTLNFDSVIASLLYVWIPENLCTWNEVRKLRPGCYLEIDRSGTHKEVQYWQPEALIQAPPTLRDEETAIDALDQCLQNSVDAHLVADVPINAFLSGGLDSSLIVAMSRRKLSKLDCYTIEFTESAKKRQAVADDAYYARRVAKALNVNLNVIEVQPDITSLLPKIVSHLDEPIGDSAAINTLLITEAAHQNGVKVLLSGMGADELFGGYGKHFANLVADRYRKIPDFIRRSFVQPLARKLPVASNQRGLKRLRQLKRFLEFSDLTGADAFLRSYTYFDREQLEKFCGPASRSSIDNIIEYHHEIFDSAKSRSLLDQMCYTDSQMFMTSLNLAYTDRSSMAASTEVRVPYIDKEVVKLAFQIASGLKINGRNSKYVLKKVAERWLPKEIINRPKSAFTLPLRAWIKTELRELIDDLVLSSHGLAGRDIFDRAILNDIVAADRSGKSDNAQRIWQLLTLEQWFRAKGI